MPDDHQHYVPQFLLRNFATGNRNKQLWAFDKRSGTSFRTTPRNVATESGFYDFSADGKVRSLDPLLQELENLVAEDIRAVIQNRVLPTELNKRMRIASFAAVQMVRTTSHRQQYRHLGEILRREIEKRGGRAPGADQPPAVSDEESNAESIRLIPKLTLSATPHFMSKSWILYSTTAHSPFYIGDSPVTLDNTLNHSEFMGTLGLAVSGIEVYLPISPLLCIGFLCPSNEAVVRESLRASQKVGIPNEDATRIIKAFEGGEPYLFKPENVLHHNSMQVAYAERFVFSKTDNFATASAMIASNPEIKFGPRFSIG